MVARPRPDLLQGYRKDGRCNTGVGSQLRHLLAAPRASSGFGESRGAVSGAGPGREQVSLGAPPDTQHCILILMAAL